MPKLTRFRLCNIGHAHARIDDLTFCLHDTNGHATHSAIWLRNGGGKTMLVSLLLWLMCPDKRMPDDRRLEHYVHTHDHSVLVAEWQLDGGLQHAPGQPDRYLTGAFCEWRTSASTADGRKLRRSFFTTRVVPEVPELTLEGLPLYVDVNGQKRRERRTWNSFRQEWQALSNAYPQAGINEAEQIHVWRSLLEQAGIDPELFNYQIHMNHHEAEAEALFKFREADQFVDFFLEMMGNTTLGHTTAQTIERFRESLYMQSEQLEPEYLLIQSLVKHLAHLKGAAQEREDVYRQILRSWRTLSNVSNYVTQCIQGIQRDVAGMASKRDQAKSEAQQKRSEATAQHRRALVLRYIASQKRHQQLQGEQKELQIHIEEYQRNEIIWHAAIPLQDALRAESRIKTYEQQLSATQQEYEPLLQQVKESAQAYAQALCARIAQLSAEEKQLRRTSEIARQQARSCRADATKRQNSAVKLEEQAKHIAERRGKVIQVRSQLERDGILLPGEYWKQAIERFTLQNANLQLEHDGFRQRVEEIVREQTNLHSLLQQLASAQATADGEIEGINLQLAVAQQKRNEIEADALLRVYLELDEVDLDQLDQSALEQLSNKDRAFDERLAQLQLIIAEHKAVMEYLADHQLLPPSRDVTTVLELLRGNQIRAWSGWEYLTENAPQTEIRASLQRLPEIAFGVVVRDDHYQKAQTVLLQTQPYLDTPVAILSQEATTETSLANILVIGPTSDAYFDRSAGKSEEEERKKRSQQDQKHLDTVYYERGELRKSIARFQHWQQEYSPTWWNERREKLVDAQARQKTSQIQIAEEKQKQGQYTLEQKQLNEKLEACRKNQVAVAGFLAQLQAHAELLTSDLEALEMEYLRYLADVEQKKREAKQLNEQADEIDGQEQDLHVQITTTVSAKNTDENDLTKINSSYLENEHILSVPGNVPVLRDRYTQLVSQYEQNVEVDAIRLQLKEIQQGRSEALQKFRKRLKAPVDEIAVRAVLDSAMDADILEQKHIEAVEAVAIAKQQYLEKGKEINEALQLLGETRQKCQSANVAEEEYHLDLPATEEVCLQYADDADRRSDILNEEARSYEALENEAKEKISQLQQQKHDLEQKQAQVQLLQNSFGGLNNTAQSEVSLSGWVEVDVLLEEDLDQFLQTIGASLTMAQEDKQRLDDQRRRVSRNIQSELDIQDYQKVKLIQQFKRYAEEDYEKRSQYLLENLEVRQKNIEDQRAEMQQQRQLVLRHLLDLAENGLNLLKNASRRSKLPSSLLAFGEKQFLKITYKELSHPEERSARIHGLLDHIIREGVVPNGVELLQKAVRRLAGPITVEVLFPDPGASQQYVPIERMARESGGERLTSTVLLYCTLTQLRAIERTNRIGASSCLILDNPIGAASRPLLLELQREVAEARNIQLIYTTGIQDFEAISMFPNIICVRNDQRDLRSGERIMQLDETEQGLQAMRILLANKHTAFQEGENAQ